MTLWHESTLDNLHGHPPTGETTSGPYDSPFNRQLGLLSNGNTENMDSFVDRARNIPGTVNNSADKGPPLGHSRYVPQFSAATSEILNRLKEGSASLDHALSGLSETARQPDPCAFKETKARLLQSLNTTLSMPAAEGPQASRRRPLDDFISGRELVDAQNASLKRKRVHAEELDFTQSTMAFADPVSGFHLPPRPPPQARVKMEAVPKPFSPFDDGVGHLAEHRNSRNATVKRCSICHQSMSLSEDRIVSCRRCAVSSHHHCLPPMRLANFVDLAEYLCEPCAKIEKKLGRLPQALVDRTLAEEHDLEVLRANRFSQFPPGTVPPKSSLVGFDGVGASDFARTEYFYGKTKTELLNLLSFADELKPQLLVDILVSVTKKHPELPLFDTPHWASKIPEGERSAVPPLFAGYRRRHGHKIQLKSRQRHKVLKKLFQPAATKEADAQGEPAEDEEGGDAGEEGNEEEEEAVETEDSFPPTWPRAGEGLYSKVVPEVEDRKFLADENDEEAFSHFMVDKLGRQIVDTTVV